MHFCDDLGSEGSEVVADYFKQLTAEEQAKVLNRRTGRTRSEWRLRKGHKRNEALDLEVYNLAGFHALNLNMKLEHKKFLQRIAETKEMESAPVQQTKPPVAPHRRRSVHRRVSAMSEMPKPKQVEIYPYNVEKADKLAAALGKSTAEMVNYLIESFAVQQITTLQITDRAPVAVLTVVRRNVGGGIDYQP